MWANIMSAEVNGFKIQYGEIYRRNYVYQFLCESEFKIQYGEIYSLLLLVGCTSKPEFKIQYGEIYS